MTRSSALVPPGFLRDSLRAAEVRTGKSSSNKNDSCYTLPALGHANDCWSPPL
jgi:hypothetical protein